MDHPSIKQHIIKSLAACMEMESLKDGSFYLLTSLGFIEGTPDFSKVEVSEGRLPAMQYALEQAMEYYQKQTGTTLPSDDDGYLLLKNVAIRPATGDVVYRLDNLVVFFDQIIGINIGTKMHS